MTRWHYENSESTTFKRGFAKYGFKDEQEAIDTLRRYYKPDELAGAMKCIQGKRFAVYLPSVCEVVLNGIYARGFGVARFRELEQQPILC